MYTILREKIVKEKHKKQYENVYSPQLYSLNNLDTGIYQKA